MKKQSYFGIVRQEFPEIPSPYRLIETVFTSDGPRTRICSGTWRTFMEASSALENKEKARDQ